MSWLGKVVGGAFGFVMGGPLGAALGAALGHQFDQTEDEIRFEGLGASPEETEQLRLAFFRGVFQVMGHIAKVDGRVSEAEIRVARTVMEQMRLSEDQKLLAMRFFNEGKSDPWTLKAIGPGLKKSLRPHPILTRRFMAIALEIALADGPTRSQEDSSLLEVCDYLGFSRYEFFGIKARMQAELRFSSRQGPPPGSRSYHQGAWKSSDSLRLVSPLDEAFGILKLPSNASEGEIKTAYRRLISRHHPDKLAASGLDQKALQDATERTQQIQKAYELIAKTRGF